MSELVLEATSGVKRPAAIAGITTNNNRSVKRRASKACQCCRARKVRCNVVEHGAPCTNCRLDEVECVITESKRKRKSCEKIDEVPEAEESASAGKATSKKLKRRSPSSQEVHSPSTSASTLSENGSPAPPINYQSRGTETSLLHTIGKCPISHSATDAAKEEPNTKTNSASAEAVLTYDLPEFIRPCPTRIVPEDVEYLKRKGATGVPLESLREHLVDAYFLYVHPYMPLIDEQDFRRVINKDWSNFDPNTQREERLSLLLYQAILFAGSAFVPMYLLRAGGYTTRKGARKAFFSRTRLLYDFDWEHDRISLVQSLLLMTYWYETPDDQKDTWHWMGVAISLSHTIGLHRNPENSNLDIRRQRLWKRIWWSCFMRDRLVALGMRRPTRIKIADCDVPMLMLSDFGIEEDSELSDFLLNPEEQRMKERQRVLASLCIEKAKLSIIISHVLSAQYSVLRSTTMDECDTDHTKGTMLLQPKPPNVRGLEVQTCDAMLAEWHKQLCPDALWRPADGLVEEIDTTIILHRDLLHMVYFTTVSALHRPQVLPSAPAPWPARNCGTELQDISRKKVRYAAQELTRLAEELIEFDLVKYLPTVGVTVMLPAVIIHLLDVKSSSPVTRELSLQGFGLCMQVMQGLRENYAAADFATHFLEAAVKKADIQIPISPAPTAHQIKKKTESIQRVEPVRRISQNIKARRVHISPVPLSMKLPESPVLALTPPPEKGEEHLHYIYNDNSMQFKMDNFLTTTALPTSNTSNLIMQDFSDIHETEYFSSEQTPSPQQFFNNHDCLSTLLSNNDADPFLGAYDEQIPQTIGTYHAGEGSGIDLNFSLMGKENATSSSAPKMLDSFDFDFGEMMHMENL